MPRTALTFYAIFLTVALGVRAAVQRWQTGSFGLRMPTMTGAPVASAVGALIVLASVLLGVVAPLLQLKEVVAPLRVFVGAGVSVVGVAGFILGLAGVLLSQFWMGASWRVGVDPSEHTRLIMTGPFAAVRNPIYSCMLLAMLGASVLVPNVVTLTAYALLVLAIELQVRVVEEPYLLRVHGQEYAAWAARVGRFIPRMGRASRDTITVGGTRAVVSTTGDDNRNGHDPSTALRTGSACPSDGDRHLGRRLHAFDALRAIAMLLGIVAHGAMSYMDLRLTPLTWAHYDEATSRLLSLVFWWMDGFRLQLFFVLAGFFAAQLYARRGPSGFLAHRATSLLLPFVVGSLTILPITYCIFAAGWWLRGACTWNEIRRTTFHSGLQAELWGPAHLWFIEYLLLYCALLCLARLAGPSLPGRARAVRQWVTRVLSSPWRVLWCAVPTFMLLAMDDTVITMHHNSFIPQPMKLLFNGLFFTIGGVLYGLRAELDRFIRGSGATLIVSLLLFAAVDTLLRANAIERFGWLGHAALCACLALFAWCSIFGFLGQAQQWLDRPHPVLRYLSDAAYWVYLIHLPIVAAVQISIALLPVPALLKCGVVVAVTATLCLWSYERWARYSIVGALLHGRRGHRSTHGVAGVIPAPVPPASPAAGG